jgi:hypothetical protein
VVFAVLAVEELLCPKSSDGASAKQIRKAADNAQKQTDNLRDMNPLKPEFLLARRKQQISQRL